VKTYKIKVVDDGEPTGQHPLAKPGWVGRCRTYAITDVPDNVPAAEVIRLFGVTVNLTWLYADASKPDQQRGRYSFRFAELGAGRMIRE
jgi:hypothetical protein